MKVTSVVARRDYFNIHEKIDYVSVGISNPSKAAV
jgi:hypothetical protein